MSTHSTVPYTLNIGGQLTTMERPLVMGILNVTTESFYKTSQTHTATAIIKRVQTLLKEGASIIDIGACSTKPGAIPINEEEEMRRLASALPIIRSTAPKAILSVDTFRATIAERCIKDYGVHIINDISGGEMDPHMYTTVADLNIPYILTYNGCREKMIYNLSKRINQLHLMGVNDIIVDPGFGFGKSLDDNYELMAHLEEAHLLGCPLLVGISRKSMIYNLLGCTPDEALNGTTALHTIALMKGAHILRAHDVKAAVEAITIVDKLKASLNNREHIKAH